MDRPDFLQLARDAHPNGWDSLNAAEKEEAVLAAKERWLEGEMGEDVEDEGFGAWLREQPTEVQNEVLGEKRATAFRAGKLEVDKFVDDARPLTLDQLASRKEG